MKKTADIHRELLESHERIKPFIHHTPIYTSTQIDLLCDGKLFFKCENFQRAGAYKMRGALNAMMLLEDDKKSKGVVTHSSGNFAQALALAAKSLEIKAYIVMPENAPIVKKQAVKTYGGIIIESGPDISDREKTAEKIQQKTGATFIHPSNDYNVILGQATTSIELLEQVPNLDYIVGPVGGGGLIAGACLAAGHLGYNCKVIGVEPENVDDAYRSLLSGKIEYNTSTNTIADGLKTHLGDLNFPIIKKNIERIITVTEAEIIEAMKLIWERMKLVVEPSSAVALAGVLQQKDLFQNRKIGILISGGNVDLKNLPF
ncbi:MAG: pyridoxal-phosphate dependent enzyme [Saprospirales bacterium]|nr:MAG: pyridoxal-phosphate dependent enzyme [Saprospirales bacterium]